MLVVGVGSFDTLVVVVVMAVGGGGWEREVVGLRLVVSSSSSSSSSSSLCCLDDEDVRARVLARPFGGTVRVIVTTRASSAAASWPRGARAGCALDGG
jgi:hypothetical protein